MLYPLQTKTPLFKGHPRLSKELPPLKIRESLDVRENEKQLVNPCHPVRPSSTKGLVRRSKPSESLPSDDDAPGLSHSWSESSVEESDRVSDLNFAPFNHKSSSLTSLTSLTTTPILDKSPPTVVLSDSLSLHSTSNQHSDSKSAATAAELWLSHSARKNCNSDTSESIVSLNHNYFQNNIKDINNQQSQDPGISRTIEQAKQELPEVEQTRRSNSRQQLVHKNSQSSQSDLMGNKLAKLKKKNVGEFSSFKNHHEDDAKIYTPEPQSASNYEKTRSHLSNSRSKAVPPYLNLSVTEKNLAIPTNPVSHHNNLSAKSVESKSAPNSTSLISPQYSGSTARTLIVLTSASSETLTLHSDSALHLPPQKSSQADISHTGIESVQTTDLSYPQKSLSGNLSEANLASTPSQTERIIQPGLPLSIIQLDCYQKHRSMRKIRNQLCPVGCMICQKMDAEMRWTCTWCYLSACADCTHVLNSIPGNNLRVCLEKSYLLESK